MELPGQRLVQILLILLLIFLSLCPFLVEILWRYGGISQRAISNQRCLTAVPGMLAGRPLIQTPLIMRPTTAHLGQQLISQPEIFILPTRLILLPLARMMIFGRLSILAAHGAQRQMF